MIKLTKVRITLTEEAEQRLEALEDSFSESGASISEFKDDYGRTKEWYEEANIPVPSIFFQKENLPQNYIDFVDEDYESKFFPLYLHAEDVDTLEDDDEYTMVHMKNGTTWVVQERAEFIYKKMQKVL